MANLPPIIGLDIDGVLNCRSYERTYQYSLARNAFTRVIQKEARDTDIKPTEAYDHALCGGGSPHARRLWGVSDLSPRCMRWFNELCEATGALILITSTWREHFSDLADFKVMFSMRGFRFSERIIGATPSLVERHDYKINRKHSVSRHRGICIEFWLRENLSPTELHALRFIALDDKPCHGRLAPYVVGTQERSGPQVQGKRWRPDGLSRREVQKALRMLDRKPAGQILSNPDPSWSRLPFLAGETVKKDALGEDFPLSRRATCNIWSRNP